MITFPWRSVQQSRVLFWLPVSLPSFWKPPEFWVGGSVVSHWDWSRRDGKCSTYFPPRSYWGGHIFSLTALAWPRGGHRTQAWENDLLPRLVRSRLEIKEWKKCTKSIDFCRSSSCYRTAASCFNSDPPEWHGSSFILHLFASPFSDFLCFLAFLRCNWHIILCKLRVYSVII